MVDPGNSALLDIEPFWTTHDPSGATWGDHQWIRFVPVDPFDPDVYNELYSTIRRKVLSGEWPSCAILADEAETCLPASAHGAAPALVFSGRKWPTAHITVATRPKTICLATRANLTNAALFPLYIDDDRKTVSADLGIPPQLLDSAMGALPVADPDGAGERGLLWWTTSTRSLQPIIC
jgi:hypothetical protein